MSAVAVEKIGRVVFLCLPCGLSDCESVLRVQFEPWRVLGLLSQRLAQTLRAGCGGLALVGPREVSVPAAGDANANPALDSVDGLVAAVCGLPFSVLVTPAGADDIPLITKLATKSRSAGQRVLVVMADGAAADGVWRQVVAEVGLGEVRRTRDIVRVPFPCEAASEDLALPNGTVSKWSAVITTYPALATYAPLAGLTFDVVIAAGSGSVSAVYVLVALGLAQKQSIMVGDHCAGPPLAWSDSGVGSSWLHQNIFHQPAWEQAWTRGSRNVFWVPISRRLHEKVIRILDSAIYQGYRTTQANGNTSLSVPEPSPGEPVVVLDTSAMGFRAMADQRGSRFCPLSAVASCGAGTPPGFSARKSVAEK